MAGQIHHYPATLPDLLVEDAGSIYGIQCERALDVTRICHVHAWASLKVPVEQGIDPPRCELCAAETQAVDGRARYADLIQKRKDGVI